MTSTTTPQAAAAAAKTILGFYPEIPASDPRGFAAGLVAMLSTFPSSVIDRAVDPVNGIPAKVSYLNLATIRKHLDAWADEFYEAQRRREIANRKRLPEPPRDPEMEARIAKGLRELADQMRSGFSPSTAKDGAP